MTIEELEILYGELKSRVDELHDLDFKNITDFDPLPAIDFDDTLLVVTSSDYTGRASIEQIMEYLNKNLRNFICWKPVVNNSTLTWERSSSDEAPGEIKFEDIMFPMASETDNGMMSSADYIKLSSINADRIIYDDTLTEILKEYAPKDHTHDRYQLKSDMPTKLTDFDNDAGFITENDIPTKVSEFENDAKYLKLEDIPTVSPKQSGFMTPELLDLLANLSDETVTTDELDDALLNLSNSFPTKVSEFINDSNYMKKDEIYSTFGELGAVNIIRNSEFRFMTPDETDSTFIVDGWIAENGTVEQYTDDPDFEYAGKVTFASNTSLGALFAVSNGYHNTVSFIAKADTAAKFNISIGDGSETVSIGTTWAKYVFSINDKGTNPSMYMRFILSDEDVTENILYITQVKVEKGNLSSDFYPSYSDLKDLIKVPATLEEYGAVLPDGDTLGFSESGRLQVMPKAINTLKIDDDTPTPYTLYSSSHIEDRLNTRAPLEGGKIPAEYLPEYLDDVLEGTMSIDSEGNYVFTVADGQYGPAEPSKGIIYLDTESNTAWRWTGTTYIQCTTDKLGGSVLVKYNAEDNYMYFVFPD